MRNDQPTTPQSARPEKSKWLLWARLAFFLCLIAGTVWVLRRQNQPYQSNEGSVFGTTYHISYQSPTDFHPEIVRILQQVDEALSLFNEKSWLSRYNAGQNPCKNAMASEVISLAMRISKETQGAFDITVAPLVNAWGFGVKHGNPPSNAQLDSLKALVGYQRYLKGERVMLDCGAIAKGYGVDCVARLLRRHGVKNFMVEIGGEVVVSGKNREGSPWRIGVARPSEASGQMESILPLTDAAMATSGNYRNFHTDSLGRRYAHTIDPRLGRPVQQTLLSATVIAPTCAEADAWATACMVMGHESAVKLMKAHPTLKYFFIYDKQGRMATDCSPELKP